MGNEDTSLTEKIKETVHKQLEDNEVRWNN